MSDKHLPKTLEPVTEISSVDELVFYSRRLAQSITQSFAEL